MHYTFPEITHLDQVLEAVQGVDGFIVAQRPWGTVVNYIQMGPDMFPEVHTAGGSASMRERQTRLKAIRRECRGMIFDLDGKLVSRPFHKFFNAGERRETLLENIDLSRPHVILDKLDGSMIRAFPVGEGYRLGTKMGATGVSEQAEAFVATRPNLDRFFRDTLAQNMTACFEWMSRQQAIVVDHPVDRLVLIAVRHTHSGEYLTHTQMQELAAEYELEVVRARPGSISSMQQLVEETRALEGHEGYIVRWSDGHMCKLKSDWYVRIHRARDALTQEKNLIDLLLEEKLDDVKSFLPVEDLARIDAYENAFWTGVGQTAYIWKSEYVKIRQQFGDDRKQFALEAAPGLEPNLRSTIFRVWDREGYVDWRELVCDVIRKSTGTQTRVDEARALFRAPRWNQQSAGDD
jgi:RNA ligase